MPTQELKVPTEIQSWPIDKLIFSWNPYLKDISIIDRLANAEVLLVKYEE